VAVIVESFTTVTPVAGLPPKDTPVVPVNPEPVIVTSVPPKARPCAGLTAVTVVADTTELTTIVNGAVTASGATALVAVIVNVEVPGVVGVPDNTPPLDRVNPAGNVPPDTANVGVGEPDAVNV